MCNITSSLYLLLLTYKQHFSCHNAMDVVRFSDSLPRMGNKWGNLAMDPMYEVTNCCCELKKLRLARMFSLTVAEGSAVYVAIHS